MYEKYNAFEPGTEGAGGKYLPQEGFGWTNGVALYLLNHSLTLPFDPTPKDGDEPDIYNDTNVTVFVLSFCAVLVACVGCREYRRKIVLPEYYVRRNRELSSCNPASSKAVQAVRSQYLYATVADNDSGDVERTGNPMATASAVGSVEDSTLLAPLYKQSDSPPRRTPEKTKPHTPSRSTGGGVAVFGRSNTFNATGASNVASPMTPSAAARQYRFPRSNTNTPGDNSLTSQFYRSPQPRFSQSLLSAVSAQFAATYNFKKSHRLAIDRKKHSL